MTRRGILLAVAVHDDGEARLQRAIPASIDAEPGVPLRFRVSYALEDNAGSRETAKLSALVTMTGQKPIMAEITMHDLPVFDDSRHGDLVFEVPALPPGEHILHYVVALETTDTGIGLRGIPTANAADLKGDVVLRVAAPLQSHPR